MPVFLLHSELDYYINGKPARCKHKDLQFVKTIWASGFICSVQKANLSIYSIEMISSGRGRLKCQDVIELSLFTCFNMHCTSKKLWGLDQQELVFTLGNSLFSDAQSLICLWFPL